MTYKAVVLGSAAVLAFVTPATAQDARPAPVAELVKAVDIPYQQFSLPNGLRVVVHTDRKAPVVAVSVWYNVGSKFEPKGKTGFAHLFEHLMFNGTENVPGDFFEPLKQIGATDLNGTTYYDRTNYFETVPTGALERTLFLESDRMGYLTGAVTQGVLDEQRGVVQNEKRQGDNQPYGLTEYKITEGLFPATHPYGHTTIGSMADLDAASLQTVKDWFHDHYGPNNAVLVLAGDVDVATAKRLVTKYFGGIAKGPASVAPAAPIPTLPRAVNETIKDRVAAVMISRNWVVPGLNDKQAAGLDVAAGVLGGLASSRLDNALVKREKLAVSVSASNSSFSQLGMFTIQAYVKPGVDPALVTRRIDEIVADFLKTGPSADEVARVVTRNTARTIGGLESVGGFGGKAVALAEGALYSNDPGFYKKQLAALATQTPASVKAAADAWLARPAYTLTVVPGPRDAYAEAQVPPKADVPAAAEVPAKGTRGDLPTVGQLTPLTFPAVQRARLSNGIELIYAQRTAVPITQAEISFDAGAAADVPNKLGTQQLTLNMLEQGTTRLDSIQIAEAEERLGADINAGSTADRTEVSLSVPSANLQPALSLWSDIVRNPAFADAEVARVKAQQLAGIQQELTSPNGLAARVMPKLLYGPASPYARQSGSGDPAAVASLTPADLKAFHQAWLRPDKAKIFVTSDRPLAEVQAALEGAFGTWRGTGAAATKAFGAASQPSRPRIVLVDRLDSPQSLIVGGIPTSLTGTQDLLPVVTANDSLGGDFLSRINMDLRETKHWSYGVSGNFRQLEHAAPYTIVAPVQADQTGPSVKALQGDLSDYLGAKPLTQAEFDRTITGAIRSLSGDFETSGAVLQAMENNDLLRRPDDYYATITRRYQGLTLPQLNTAIRGALDPAKTVWVVVGDAKVVKPQLDSLGLPVEVVPAASVATAR
ncbi:Predicted Zn-dependent peptidase [Sphingomonas gellani]|uniref:Predicted Zn-dependent peptidase n=1 Tax=Sphingomonas gellani TaxID=1166340 RepID=A0A1H8IXE0_9SPHN|nr:pitrilysin family protein [Sphingomonas gellani]SEN73410.1 Predicted Zn-dependent peptidase [Sphingomonas gellani]